MVRLLIKVLTDSGPGADGRQQGKACDAASQRRTRTIAFVRPAPRRRHGATAGSQSHVVQRTLIK